MSKILPIPIPGRIIQGQSISAAWANRIRESIIALANRKTTQKQFVASQYIHPFKLLPYWDGTTPKLRVQWGAHYSVVLRADSNNDTIIPSCQPQDIIGGCYANDPSGNSGTPETLATETAYGVWLKMAVNTQSSGNPTNAFGGWGGFKNLNVTASGSSTIEVSSTYNDKDDLSDITATTEDYSFLWLGKVTVGLANEPFTVEQWIRSDIFAPAYSWPSDFVSTDTGNSLDYGSEGGLFVPPIASADANNNIGTGTDGGAYYNDPDY